ncbi:putative minor capsid protein [Convivina intestini]|uniref:Minor capsid protein n=1 Tax=Convivina intestini TaxID=1505726 RepID=A0A2U1DFP8_9LACO|nr:putative minor capsid protein [Convivina intestini]PVY86513.1 minor capsid protein [Convivina intestini]CAH1857473.1 hypothetical protein R077811_01523 [Convivina intestini]SDC13122.1 Minor capsid protein [Leuconostocaceae bacterium R-53105]
MIIPKVPKALCNQNIIYKRPGDPDDWGGVGSTIDTPIANCVVQLQTICSGTNNNREVVANGSVYLYAGITTPMPTLTKTNQGDVISFDGIDYTVKTIIEHRDPLSNDIWSYKLEVL